MNEKKQILTLCTRCAKDYYNSPEYYIKPIYPRGNKENCTKCNGSGYDYEITPKSRKGKI